MCVRYGRVNNKLSDTHIALLALPRPVPDAKQSQTWLVGLYPVSVVRRGYSERSLRDNARNATQVQVIKTTQ